MNILVIGTIDNKGGAAQISWEIRKRLKAEGHTVNTFVRYKYSNEPDVFVIPRKHYQDWLVKLFANDLRFAKTDYIFDTREYKEADIIHCHNIHSNFFNLKNLIRMSREKTVVWTIHDLWAITGFASDSVTRKNPNKKKFLLYLWDNTKNLLKTKEKIYEKSILHIIAVSNWIKNECESGILRKQDTTLIHNGVDIEVYRPYEKSIMRNELKLPADKIIIGFGIKGWTLTKKLMDLYASRDDIVFLQIGHSNIQESAKCISVGYISDKTIMAKHLSALDVFFYPTQGDSFGLVAAEAMACGTPVVTFNIDALPEIVSHKETGYITKHSNENDAKNGVDYILGLTEEQRINMSHKCRESIEKNFSLETMYEKYKVLYKKLVQNKTT